MAHSHEKWRIVVILKIFYGLSVVGRMQSLDGNKSLETRNSYKVVELSEQASEITMTPALSILLHNKDNRAS